VTALLGGFTGWLLFAALLLALGSVCARWLLVPRATPAPPSGSGSSTNAAASGASGGSAADGPPPAASHLLDTAARLGLFATLLLPLAMGLVFHRQLSEFRDPFVPWREDASLLLTGTSWGRTWLVGTFVALAAVAALGLCRAGIRGSWPLATVMLLALATFPALTGHAAGAEALRPLTLTADTLHVLAAGSWIGGLAFVLYAERRWRRAGANGSLLPVLVPAFSRVAITSVVTLVATGSIASWVHLESVSALVSTPYGRLLSIKLLLVAMVLAMGAVNWRVLTPRLGDPDGAVALRRAALVELTVAQLVLVVTAVLVRTSPL
jgi:putative copper export protein